MFWIFVSALATANGQIQQNAAKDFFNPDEHSSILSQTPSAEVYNQHGRICLKKTREYGLKALEALENLKKDGRYFFYGYLIYFNRELNLLTDDVNDLEFVLMKSNEFKAQKLNCRVETKSVEVSKEFINSMNPSVAKNHQENSNSFQNQQLEQTYVCPDRGKDYGINALYAVRSSKQIDFDQGYYFYRKNQIYLNSKSNMIIVFPGTELKLENRSFRVLPLKCKLLGELEPISKYTLIV